MLWLLMRRLALMLPTALQVHKDYAILFHADGVSPFANLDDPQFNQAMRGRKSERIWALIDTNTFLSEPAQIFKHKGPFFVVGAEPPCPDHADWLLKIDHERFYMR